MPKGTAVGISLPTGGLRRDLPRHFVPDDASYDLNNVFVHNGKLITRYGTRQVHSNFPDARIMGLISYVFIGSPQSVAVRNVAATTTGLWAENGATWVDLTLLGAELSGGPTRQVRMAVFPIGGLLHVIAVNGFNSPIKWNNSFASEYAPLAGGAPSQAMDITVCSNQVILLVNINDDTFVRISSVNDAESWPATKVAILSETQDGGVAVKRLTRTSFVVYKNNSQWLGTSQPGTTLGFRFELIDTKPGPIATAAVVDVGNTHYYMGNDFRIYRFDGTRAQEVFPGVRPWLEDNLNYSRRWRAHGAYFHLIDKIVFWFPIGADDDPSAGLILDPQTGAGFSFSMGFEAVTASAAYQAAYSVLLGGTTGNIFIHDENAFADGDGEAGEEAIEAYWESPLRAHGGISNLTRVHFFDTFFEDSGAAQNVSVEYGTTDTLANAPSFGDATTIDINVDERHKIPPDPAEVDLVSRFLTVRHSYSANTVRPAWVGGVLSIDSVSLD